jgi:hypothetical protein
MRDLILPAAVILILLITLALGFTLRYLHRRKSRRRRRQRRPLILYPTDFKPPGRTPLVPDLPEDVPSPSDQPLDRIK